MLHNLFFVPETAELLSSTIRNIDMDIHTYQQRRRAAGQPEPCSRAPFRGTS